MNSAYKNILVFNLNWLGDILFSLPSLEAIKTHYPNSHLACIVPHTYRNLLENKNCIDEVIAVSDKTLWSKYRLLRQLRQKKWDIGFLFHRSKTRARLFKWANVQERIGYDSKDRAHLLTCSIPFPSIPQHKMDIMRSLLLSYGISHIKESYEYHAWQAGTHTKFELPTPYVVFHPGSNWAPKRWPIRHFAQLGNELHTHYGASIVITGTKEDKILAQQMKPHLHQIPIDLTGQTSLEELAAICRHSLLVIAGDTGPMHLATASGAKVIALYGPTSPLLNGPRGPQTNFKVIWENPCLENLTPQRVLTEIENWKILYEKNIISSK